MAFEDILVGATTGNQTLGSVNILDLAIPDPERNNEESDFPAAGFSTSA